MTGTRVAALVMIPLAIIAGVVGGRYWHVTHSPRPQVTALADRPVTAAPAPSTSPAPAPQVAARDPAPTIGTLPQIDAPKSPAESAANTRSPSPAPNEASPSFDVVRVEPQGDAVVAGKGAPNAKVALLSGGKVVGEATSDASGQFVILPQRLAPGDHALTLRQTPEGAPVRESTQSVAVSVPQPGTDKSKVVVALAEPGKATKLLSPPPGASTGAASPAAPPGKVIIRSAELENGSGVYVSGAAQAGTSVHVYLNDSHIADVVAGADGAWSVRVKHGLTGGHYNVRADAAGADGKVTARAEVPFDVPVLMAQAGKPQVAAPAPAAVAPVKAAAPPPARETTAPKTATAEEAAPAPARAVPGDARPARETAAPTAETANAGPAPAPVAPAPGADATIESIATARVTQGDNLWNISRFRLGDGLRYTQIYAANSEQIRDPNLIYPGQVFVVPQH